MEVPEPVEDDIFEMSREEMEERGIGSVAANLKEAIDALTTNDMLRESLGDFTTDKLIEAKTAEWDDYRVSVSPWEIERYLETY